MSLTLPVVLNDGQTAYAEDVMANLAAIAAKFTEGAGGISDGDISSSGAIKGSKLSSVAGNRVTQAQLEDDAVTSRVLKDDATSGSPNAAVGSADHIKDGIITNQKLANLAVRFGKLSLGNVLVTLPGLGGDSEGYVATGLLSTAVLPICFYVEAAGATVGNSPIIFLHLNTNTNEFYVHGSNPRGSPGSSSMSVRVFYINV